MVSSETKEEFLTITSFSRPRSRMGRPCAILYSETLATSAMRCSKSFAIF